MFVGDGNGSTDAGPQPHNQKKGTKKKSDGNGGGKGRTKSEQRIQLRKGTRAKLRAAS